MNRGITDPSDWPAEFSPLREIDSNLRCPICKELLRAAIMLQCFHNFCSECIRRHLDKESTCPACRVQTSTAQMRRNVALDEIANSFGDCRSLLLKTVTDSLSPPKHTKPAQLSRAESMDLDDLAPQTKRRRTSSRISSKSTTLSSPTSQDTVEMNGLVDSAAEDDNDKDDDFMVSSQGSSSIHKGKSVSRSTAGPTLRSRAGRSEPPITVLEKTPEPARSWTTTAPQPPSQPASPSHVATATAPTPPTKPTTLVACPVCSMGIPEAYTNTHLDRFCFRGLKDPAYTISFELIMKQAPVVIETYERQGTTTRDVVGSTASNTSSPQKPSSSSLGAGGGYSNGSVAGGSSDGSSPLQHRTMQLSISGSPVKQPYPELKRIPKLAYGVLNEKQLRKKLLELGLPCHGDKQLMQKRHAEYVTIYNANCDATRPQTITQLKKTLQIWEETYLRDLDTKLVQRRQLEQQQARQQAELAQAKSTSADPSSSTVDATSSAVSTPLSSEGASSTGGEAGSSSFVPNQANNTNVAVAVAKASAFAHVLKYADEYAELIADVRRRQQIDKEKRVSEDTTKAE
ncbi:E3 ubiquitin-protein ligase rad18 [Dissophora globulifera]|uniref:Postreplication repair E3 ubiquitin-protein ligase RAD18 n=1 Tax=Dissophora globulifera TaxID=979702 RepID=A0A9P6R6A4_9FUNG|nr:E3 ubiquitin-protein ligase rad18 [Dissophora globulifera]